MCGLVGIFGKIDSGILETVFEDMLIMDAVRGKDSTGVAILAHEKAKVKVIKGAVSPLNIINSEPYEKAKYGHHLLMMGHNRAATIGEASDKNAHPFRCKHITLAHNGTLLPGCDILKNNKFDTDSEAIGHLIADQGIEKTYSQLDGAATLTYWDEKNRTFNIISDGKRSFYFAYNDDANVLFYASELWMIRAAVERNKEKLLKEGDTEIWYPTKHTLFSFRLKKDKIVREAKTLQEFKYTYTGGYGNYGGFQDDWDNEFNKPGGRIIPFFERNKVNRNSNSFVPLANTNFKPSTQTVERYIKEYEHLLAPKSMSEEEFNSSHKECFLCKESVTDAYRTTVVVGDRVAICRPCVYTAYVNGMDLETVHRTCH